ncbi:MAG: DUF4129 domain-containing protein [Pirellulales bacterium]|nr:DUF4129 domain-containing protein [Pirellulales bacterium]
MGRRLDKTLIDYIVIAISPALIMTLVGSLVFFLVEVFYQGNYPGRLCYVFGLFVFAAVLVARISIEEGVERAVLFAIPLALATVFVVNYFVEFRGEGIVQRLSWLINCGLVGLVWWCAHKLTWDCTLIDETQDSSGEGLLQWIRWRRPSAGAESEPESLKEQEPQEPEGVTSPEGKFANWQERLFDHRRRPHAPGVWVVYLSLAALPLFGVGQRFIPVADVASRQYVFRLLCLYAASGLGLLLTTSFLGLRRYLRQRKLPMPITMAGAWLAIGSTLIVALLVFSALLPRPGAEYAVSRLPWIVGSPDQRSSPYGVGTDGVEDAKSASEAGQTPEPSDHRQESSKPDGASGTSAARTDNQNATGNAEATDHQDATGNRDTAGEQDQTGKQDPTGEPDLTAKSQSGERAPANPSLPLGQDTSDTTPAEEKQDGGRQQHMTPQDRSDQLQSDHQGSPEQPKSAAQPAPRRDSATKKAPPRESEPPASFGSALREWLLAFFKFFFYLAVILLAAYWLWRHRDKVRAAWQDMLRGWWDFWATLCGRKNRESEEESIAEARPHQPAQRPFADFVDPFTTGEAGHIPPEELVRYSFEALEAWGREHGCARRADQTPHEFAQHVGASSAFLSGDAHRLAELYCRAAYAPGELPDAGVDHLRRFWSRLLVEA